MSTTFQRMLTRIRAIADSEAHKGRLFERVMKAYFEKDPLYADQFSEVSLWSDWAARRPGFSGTDTGIDLVAEMRDGGCCAIQCKCYAPNTTITKPHLDSFISASARPPFTARIVVDTGGSWGRNARDTIRGLTPPCRVLRPGDLLARRFDWPDLATEQPESLSLRIEPFRLRPHQRAAFDDVIAGFREHDRGKLVMACGTGKTFTALRIAEEVAGRGGRVLYLVPSISLFQQTMREWAEQHALPHRYVGICSDTRAGRHDEDAAIEELEIPVTTDPDRIAGALTAASREAMTVVFCTYHSLPLVERAQDEGAPAFDLALCDEAHRTTGIERADDGKPSPFVLIHHAQKIRARKRLYLTATPRLYTEAARAKAARHDVEVFSMDAPATYGPEFHRLPFSRAVEQDLLSDYKVVVLAISEQSVDKALQKHLATSEGEINLDDAAKIVGCWRALQNPEGTRPDNGPTEPPVRPLRRAIAFTNTIASSQRFRTHWAPIVEQAVAQLPAEERSGAFRCRVEHVDGQHHALERRRLIEWLKSSSEEAPDGGSEADCRILSNARCLSEGIDVPALDAVLFMSPRASQVEIVQAVGRAMRKAPGKKYGYIVLPVAIPAEVEPSSALDDNERFAPVWGVLRALRSHDDRFDAAINRLDLNRTPTDRIIILGGEGEGEDPLDKSARALELPFPPLDLPPGAIYAKIVEKCGDRKYWETWAKDVAEIFGRLVTRIRGLLDNPENETLREWFDAFHDELRASINESITPDSAVHMMAQHILTRPVFEALFEHYDFARGNPVAKALDALRRDFGEFGLENETRDLEGFYESVRARARGLDNPEARQRVLMELYENFFATAMKKDADRLGIVYTPVEVVDFLLASADQVLREEFDRSLSDEEVHVLDPFTGTGIFLVRLLQSEWIRDADLVRKYRNELHANEIVLLAYYIAAIHIEEAFQGRRGPDHAHEPFGGIVLTDTFNMYLGRARFPRLWLPDNSERAERQQKLPIEVIVGNPPWSAGQRSSADDNPNVDYPWLEGRVAETYAARSRATLKNSLYDTYKMAIRWASDRIGEQGVLAFVTNGSWIDGNVDSGVRACLAEEFSAVHVVNLRGNQRTQGERSRREGGKIFGQGSRAPVALMILVRNPKASHEGCRILYHDIGDYLKREEKLAILREAGSIQGIADWREIAPDEYDDWIAQRDEAFEALYPLGSKAAKAGTDDGAIFRLFSNGYKTGRDTYLYNFSRRGCAGQASKMVAGYRQALEAGEDIPVAVAARDHSANVHWDDKLMRLLERRVAAKFSISHVRATAYRPFIKQYLYADPLFAQRPARTSAMFPSNNSENRAICVTGVGSTKPFSALMVGTLPDLEVISKGQCFARYRYEPVNGRVNLFNGTPQLERVDNISDTALRSFRVHYGDRSISKDAVFDYVYGVLHATDYRNRFADDLTKELPRIPLAPDFHAFAEAGRELAALHLGYETCDEYPLELIFTGDGEPAARHFRLGTRAMRFAGSERRELIVNEHVRLAGIPAAAHAYQVNGRTPLEWFVDRYRIKTDKQSGIVNDPNGWFDDPRDLITAIRRIVHLSVETARLVDSLPDSLPPETESGQGPESPAPLPATG